MNARIIPAMLVMCFVGLTLCSAQDALMGTWKLDESKTKSSEGAPKHSTVIFKATGDKVRVIVIGIDGEGKPEHSEWIGKFDGKDYRVTGDPLADTKSYRKIDDRTLEVTVKKDGKVVASSLIIVSADGKKRTVTANGTRSTKATSVYEKQ